MSEEQEVMSAPNYPSEMVYFLSSLSAFSTNTFKIQNSTGDTAVANNILRFVLPSNTLLNMKSIALAYVASCGNSGANAGARLPANVNDFVERYELSSGGLQIASGCNAWNVLCSAKRHLFKDESDPVLSHNQIVRTQSYINNVPFVGTANEEYTDSNYNINCVNNDWEGVIKTFSPSLLSTNLLPELVLTIYLAGNEILTSSAGTALSGTNGLWGQTSDFVQNGNGEAKYQLSNIHLMVEACNMGDGVYQNLIENTIRKKGHLDCGFTQHLSFTDTTANSVRFNVASQSISSMMAVHRRDGYATQKAPIVPIGYKVANITQDLSGVGAGNASGQAGFDAGGVFDLNKENYRSQYFDFPEPPTGSDYSQRYYWNLNQSQLPQFQANWSQMYQISRNSLPEGDRQMKEPLETCRQHNSVQLARLDLPRKAGEEHRTYSGLNSAGVNLQAYYQMSGVNASRTINVFVACDSTLLIGEGKNINVVM